MKIKLAGIWGKKKSSCKAYLISLSDIRDSLVFENL